jgi:peptide/nickel transport system substrate-binding protein
MNYIAGPSLPILATQLTQALAEGTIPYQPTLGQFITAAEATERWTNLQAWYEAKGHLWIGTGPFYLESAYSVEKIVHLKRFADFPDPAEKWVGFAEPKIAQVEVSGPAIVTIGTEAEFLLDATFKGEPYPVADVDFVSYMVVDAEGEIAVVGDAEAVRDGLWKVVLTAEATELLATGSARLQVAFAPVVVAIPTFASLGLVVLP